MYEQPPSTSDYVPWPKLVPPALGARWAAAFHAWDTSALTLDANRLDGLLTIPEWDAQIVALQADLAASHEWLRRGSLPEASAADQRYDRRLQECLGA